MPFTLDRTEAAAALEISTRTLDRYVKSGKLRSKKAGKKVYIHDGDLERIKHELSRGFEEETDAPLSERIEFTAGGDSPEIVFFEDGSDSGFKRRPLLVDYRELFETSQKSIEEKDRVIRELSFRVGQAEAELKNSVSLLEHKKTAYLLEAAKSKSDEERVESEKEIEALKSAVESEKTTTMILVIALVFLLLGFLGLWFVSA